MSDEIISRQFSPDYEYLYVQYSDGSIEATPTKLLTDEQKQLIYQEIYE